ncbi:homeobox domain-containing protein [Chlamydoabsidia padenii]|nr:homeobox domain-containing protein [Chlamydoabsidia padenii]
MISSPILHSSQQQQQQQQKSQQQESQQQDNAHIKKRTRVTPTQLSILEDTFSVSATPDSKLRKHLAQKLQMPERSIQIWFQNRRAKVKLIQRRSLIREEQEMVRAKIYAEAAAAAAAAAASGTLLTPASASSLSSSSHYWHGPPPPPPPPPSALIHGYQYPITRFPIQQSWITDLTPPPPPPPPPLPLAQFYQFDHSSTLSSSYAITGTPTEDPTESFYHSNLSPSPTPNPSEINTFNDNIFIDDNSNMTTIGDLTSSPNNLTTGTINVNTVTIGTWHRMKISHQDLLCYFNSSTRTFEWYIRDSNYHFKMVISFDHVNSMGITIIDNGIFAQMDLVLNEPPLFYMEIMDDSTWIQCSDFTEEMQATCHLHHTLRGLASDLKQDLVGMASMDPHLCHIIRFPPVPPQPINNDLPEGMTTLDPSSLMSSSAWRQQSLPLTMKEFEWSNF